MHGPKLPVAEMPSRPFEQLGRIGQRCSAEESERHMILADHPPAHWAIRFEGRDFRGIHRFAAAFHGTLHQPAQSLRNGPSFRRLFLYRMVDPLPGIFRRLCGQTLVRGILSFLRFLNVSRSGCIQTSMKFFRGRRRIIVEPQLMPNSDAAIHLDHLSRHYTMGETHVRAVDDVTLSVPPARSVVPLKVAPDDTVAVAPLEIVVARALPPAATLSVPPLDRMSPLPTPPEAT